VIDFIGGSTRVARGNLLRADHYDRNLARVRRFHHDGDQRSIAIAPVVENRPRIPGSLRIASHHADVWHLEYRHRRNELEYPCPDRMLR